MNIVCIGSVSSKIGSLLEKYSQYNLFYIDDQDHGGNSFIFPRQLRAEDYETNCIRFNPEFKSDEVLVLITGSGDISSCSLAILEQIKQYKISILFIEPDLTLVSNENEKKQNRLVKNVLQEKARAGIFERCYLVSNKLIADQIGPLTIKNYYNKINETIAYAINEIMICEHTEPLIANIKELPREENISRINTIGFFDVMAGMIKPFYDLDYVREKCYYYILTEKELNENVQLLSSITENVKRESNEGKIRVGFSIHSTDSEYSYGIIRLCTHMVQDNWK